MTVTSSIQDVTYATDGVSTYFNIPFYFLRETDIVADKIDANGGLARLSYGTDFNVSGAGDVNGGTLTTLSVFARGSTLHIYRIVPVTQETEYQQNDAFPAKTAERALDKLTMIAQQHGGAIVNSIRFPISEYGRDGVLPSAPQRSMTVLGFDANGNLTMLPMPASVGAGDLRNESWTDVVDYQAGISTSVQLSRTYGTKANLGTVVMAGVAQDPNSYRLAGNTLEFLDESGALAAIPEGVNRIWCVGGTTLALNQPAQYSVGDESLAWGAILGRCVDSIDALRGLSAQHYDRAFVFGYFGAGDGGGGAYRRDPTDSTSGDNGGTIIVADDGARWKLSQGGPVSVKQFGARGDGSNDDAPAIQACVAACSDVYVPDGTYRLGSTTPSPKPLYYAPQNILIQNKNAWRLTFASGAILTPATGANSSCMFTIYKCQNFHIEGPTFLGNRAGLPAGSESVGINLASVVNFSIDRFHLIGNWGDSGTAFGGDWWVNGRISQVTADQIGQGFDVAFMQNVTFENVLLQGYSIATGGAGNVGFNTSHDLPAIADNDTGVSLLGNNTNRLYFKNFRVANMNAGALITTGSFLFFDSDCDFSYNAGTGAGAPGYGVVLSYNNSGAFSSVGFPVNHVYFEGSKFINNGGASAGGGILIDGSQVTNGDLLSSIVIRGCVFDNNVNTAVQSTGETHLSSIIVENCNFTGAFQTTGVSAGITNLMVTSALPNNARVKNNFGLNPTGFIGKTLPSGTGAANTVTNTFSFPVKVFIFTQTFVYAPVLVAPSALGGVQIPIGNVGANTGPLELELQPGYGIFFNTAVPVSWEWMGI
ncbi:hypothetical protein L0Y93_10650 [Burkholderia multivorans]|uniref:glycosyl hydrolase family 28-related protein n=1 Tax=Burkholderia multivorans TaxID=87883 RepID=UPI00207D19F3|nr:glycosyl hydrolase family 28-related protein [Burkholderia multivorans]MCO1462052.1 hypothetical protein [Burkholderia multivorans]